MEFLSCAFDIFGLMVLIFLFGAVPFGIFTIIIKGEGRDFRPWMFVASAVVTLIFLYFFYFQRMNPIC